MYIVAPRQSKQPLHRRKSNRNPLNSGILGLIIALTSMVTLLGIRYALISGGDNAKAAQGTYLNISPDSGPLVGGQTISITGTNFSPGEFNAALKAGGGGSDSGRGVARDSNKNTYISGLFSNTAVFGQTSITSSGSSDAFIAKYNSNNAFQWVKKGGGSGTESAEDVAVDSAGNVYAVGYYSGAPVFDTTTLTSYGGDDIFIVKYDPTGGLMWAKRAGGSGNDRATSVYVDPSGNVYMGGYYKDSATFESQSIPGTNTKTSGFVAKYSSSGTLQFVKTITGNDNQINGVSVNANRIAAIGTFNSTVSVDSTLITSRGGRDGFIVQYDLAGSLINSTIIGGSKNDSGQGISINSTNSVCIAATIDSAGSVGSTALTRLSGPDIVVAGIAANNSVSWTNSITNKGTDVVNHAFINDAGECIIAGQLDSTTFDALTFTSKGGMDAVIINYSPSGVSQWIRGGGGSSADSFNSVVSGIGDDKNLIAVGQFSSNNATFGVSPNITTIATAGGNDVLLANINQSTGVQFGQVNATQVTYVSSTQLSVVVPPSSASGTVSVKITSPDGTITTEPTGYTYINPALTLDQITTPCSATATVNATYTCTYSLPQSSAPGSPIFASTGDPQSSVSISSSPWVQCSFTAPTLTCANIPSGSAPGSKAVVLAQQAQTPTAGSTGTIKGTVQLNTTPLTSSVVSSLSCQNIAQVSTTISCTVALKSGNDFVSFSGSMDIVIGTQSTTCTLPTSGTNATCSINSTQTTTGPVQTQLIVSGSTNAPIQGNAVTFIPKIVTNGLLLYIDADNAGSYSGSGQQLTDLSNKNNTLVLGNDLTSTNDPVFQSSGIKRFSFNGSNQYLSSANPISSTSSFSYEVWVNKPANQAQNQSLIQSETVISTPSNATNPRYALTVKNKIIGSDISSSTSTTSTSSGYTAGSSWQLVSVTYDDATREFNYYINGNKVSVSTNQLNTPGTGLLSVGCKIVQSQCSEYLNGDIAIIRMYDRALNQTEIAQNFGQERSRFGFSGATVTTINVPVSINFNASNVSDSSTTVTTTLSNIVLQDKRTSFGPWTAFITVSDFTNSSFVIPASNVKLSSGSIATNAGVSTSYYAGVGGSFSNATQAQTLVNYAGNTGGGSISVSPQLTITIPPFARSGTYTGTVTISIS